MQVYKTQIHCSLPVIRATFCLIFGIFVGFQKSHRFISYFNFSHGCQGSGWGLQFLLQIVVRFIHSYCKIFISTFNTDRRGTVAVGTIQFAINIFYFLYSINHRLLMGVVLPLLVLRHCKTVLKTFIPFLYLQTSFTVSTAAYFDVNKLLHVVCRSLIWLFRSSYFSDLSSFHLLLYTK